MKIKGFFRSIHVKLVLIFALLITLVLQIIGAYFVRQLEATLLENFETSIQERVDLLAYYVSEEMVKERNPNEDPTLEEAVYHLLRDFNQTTDIAQVKVIEGSTLKIIGTSDPLNQGIVGQRTTDKFIWRVIATSDLDGDDETLIDPQTGNRVWILVRPILHNGDVIGAIHLTAKKENVYTQMKSINNIFATGTVMSFGITAILTILLARTITKPISDMRKHALALSKGNFSRKVKVYGDDEIGQLAQTFNVLTKKLQEAQTTMEGERRKLSSVLSYMTDGVISTDRRGRVILINEQALDMLKVSRETSLSMPVNELLGIADEYSYEDLLKQTDSIILDLGDEKNPYFLRANFSVIQKDSGFINGLIVVLHDITEQEKVDMERREFVANVSHELRTPLTTMRSYLEALMDGAWKDKEIAPRFLEVVQNETERMIRLVNDLLQLSRMDSKDYTLHKEWVNLVEFYNQVIDRFEMTKEQHVTFKRRLLNYPVYAEIDKDKMTQVLDNIISNALKYSPEGGTIVFSMLQELGKIVISVSDEGVGIPKDKLEKIFERFYRVDKARTRKMGGTGLGLAIAKEVVEAHGGKIWAESTEGLGTTIYFSLPYNSSYEDDWS